MKRANSLLADRFRIDESKIFEKKDFIGDSFLFDRIDRNGDGQVEAADFLIGQERRKRT